MRSRSRPELRSPGQGWLVTFADLMTLLFCFFVLLLSMSSLDRSVVHNISNAMLELSGLSPSHGAGRVPPQFRFMSEVLDNPVLAYKNPKRIQDILFPDEVLPPQMTRSRLEENVQVLLRPDGVALVLSDGVLFAPGQSEVSEDAKKMLSQFAQFLATISSQVNIAGYTDDTKNADVDNLTLSADRAVSVLKYFLEFGLDPGRFSVAGYGEAFPLVGNDSPAGKAKNRRVEILLKTVGQTYL